MMLFMAVSGNLMLAWGVVYYVLLALLDAREFFKAQADMREKKARGWEI